MKVILLFCFGLLVGCRALEEEVDFTKQRYISEKTILYNTPENSRYKLGRFDFIIAPSDFAKAGESIVFEEGYFKAVRIKE